MKTLYSSLLLTLGLVLSPFLTVAQEVPLSDGMTFNGWEGDTTNFWRIEDGAFVGGTLAKTVPRNDFLCTRRNYTNFVLKVKFRLVGVSGFINGGVQFRSQRAPGFEAAGYQADMGDPAWWGCLYDESRRNKVLVQANEEQVKRHLKRDRWNDYVIRCEGPRIQLWINGYQTVDYIEKDPAIPNYGIIGLQIHGGGKAEASYKDITIQELP